MKKTAVTERNSFWKIFDQKLMENGEPFSIIHERSDGTPTYWGNVNRKKAFGPNNVLNIEFKYQRRKIRVGIYLWNDLLLFDRLYMDKEQIEAELGFSAEWNHIGVKNENTRRVFIEFPLILDEEYYADIIDEILPYVMKFKEVFEPRIRDLFDTV